MREGPRPGKERERGSAALLPRGGEAPEREKAGLPILGDMVALYGHVGIAIAETPTAAPYEGEYGMKKLITALVMVLAFAVSASAAV